MRRSMLVVGSTALLLGASVPLGNPVAAAVTTCGATGSGGMGGMKGMKGMHGMDHGTSSATPCPTVPGARRIAVTADRFAFSPSAISIAAGEDVTIALTAGDLTHDFEVKGVGHVVHAKKGRTAVGGLRIDTPGTYRFWCTVPGHRKSGMVGTITVT